MATRFFKGIHVEVDQDIVERIAAAYPGQSVEELILKAAKKLIGDAALRQFAAQKQAEVQAEAQRLNQELGLA